MKSFLAIALATSALMAVTPSFAQNNNSNDDIMRGLRSLLGNQPQDSSERDLNDQERRLTDLIEQSANERRLDHGQAEGAFNELRKIHDQQDELRNRHGGQLTQRDHDYVRDRLASLDRQIDQMRESNTAERVAPPPPRQHDRERDGYNRDDDRRDFWDRAPRDLDQREEWLEQKMRSGLADGSLSQDEGHRGFDLLRSLRQSETSYMRRDHGNLSDMHMATLEQRLDDIGRQLRWN